MAKKPEIVWNYFEELAKIPRPSGMEEKASQWVYEIGKKHSLETKKDEVFNVVIKVPATKGFEKAETVILQGHLDMVCEKNSNVKHDFEKDPIRLKVEGDWIKADGTTLGADNGIGVAMALALLDDKEAKHPPLELLFTIDEERGLKGANSLKKGFVTGRRLINLDTEEEGAIYIGCAGGTDTVITLGLKREKCIPPVFYTVAVTGLRGGHSGSDIHKGRGNANQILARVLRLIEKEKVEYNLFEIWGGSKRNAIPREAFATISIIEKDTSKVKKLLSNFEKEVRYELRGIDENVEVSMKKVSSSKYEALNDKTKRKVLDLLFCIPHGVISFDREIKDLVETSTNFAIVDTEEKNLKVITSQRSSLTAKMEWAAERNRVLASLAGGKGESSGTYHGWAPNLNSPLLKIAKDTYKKLTKKEPEAKAIHAGLECGILGEKFEGIDMISIGPTIKNAHSPDEKVSISSVERTYSFLKELLKELAKK